MKTEEKIELISSMIEMLQEELYSQKDFSTFGNYLEDAINDLTVIEECYKDNIQEEAEEEYWGDKADDEYLQEKDYKVEKWMKENNL